MTHMRGPIKGGRRGPNPGNFLKYINISINYRKRISPEPPVGQLILDTPPPLPEYRKFVLDPRMTHESFVAESAKWSKI